MTQLKYPPTIRILVCMALAAGVLTVYGPVAGHGFINFDDPYYVTKNPHVQGGISMEGITWALTTNHVANWHPLTWFSHMLDWELFGANAMGHHWTSVLIHLANSVLLFWLLETMTGSWARSALVAALFALHPLHVESVAWISERKDVLCTFFWFSALTSYLAYAQKPSIVRYFSTALLFILALASKPMAVTFPFLLFVIDYWPLQRLGWGSPFYWNVALEKVPLMVLAAASSILTICAQLGGGTVVPLVHVPFSQRLANALVSYGEYLLHTIWPVNLTVFYPLIYGLPLWMVILSACFLIAVTILAIKFRRQVPYLLSGWLWYVGSLIPVIGLVQVGSQRMADRYTYVPLVGIFIIFSWGGSSLLRHLKLSSTVRATLGALLASALIPLSYNQVGYWKDSLTLFSHAVANENPSAVAYFHLAGALASEKRLDDAISYYKKALDLNPHAVNARINLAMTYLESGNPQAAIIYLRQAQARAPNDPGVYNNLGSAYLQSGDAASAVLNFEKAAELNSDMIPALYNLSRVYAVHSDDRYRNGERAVLFAEKLCERTGRRNPVFLDILAAAYAEAHRFDQAVSTATQALDMARRYGLTEFADDLERRLILYRRGEPDRRTLH